MKQTLIAALTALGLAAGALAGCGSSQTKTVTVAGAPAVTHSTPTTSVATATTATATTSTATAPTSTAGGTAAPRAHTAPEPEFTQAESHAEGLGEALALLKARGYTAGESAQYHPSQTLRVLVGTRSGSSDGYGQQAFFFVDGRYIGTDTREPSATVKVLAQSDTEVTLAYPLYRAGDPLSDPSGGQATVHFQLNNGKLTPLDPIPPASSTNGTSRN
ncbi:MAG TPA: LppP/LprE family lipoprotein [Solirubrobacteraceae bacterium]|nr:LppP/LprE family lipoprotein [Solirubrobacteraceae bacterium]